MSYGGCKTTREFHYKGMHFRELVGGVYDCIVEVMKERTLHVRVYRFTGPIWRAFVSIRDPYDQDTVVLGRGEGPSKGEAIDAAILCAVETLESAASMLRSVMRDGLEVSK